MLNYFEKIRIFRKFLFSYLLILIIPLLASFLIYQINILKLKEKAIETSENLLYETINTIDQKNDDLGRLAYQLSLDLNVQTLMFQKSKDDANLVYDIYKVRNSISPYWFTNNSFRNFYIYFNNIDIIVSPESAYVRPKDFYALYSYKGLTFDEWNKMINQEHRSRYYLPSTTVRIGNNNESVITYVQSLPFNNKKNPKANIVVMIKENEFTSLLNRISTQYDGAAFIFDEHGQIIASDNLKENIISFDKVNKSFTVTDKNYIYIQSTSKFNNWTYAAIISKKELSKDVEFIRTISFIIALVTIILGILVALLFSYRQSIPLDRLFGIMKFTEMKKVRNPFDFLHSSVEEMIISNNQLSDKIQNQLPILRDSVIKKLMYGDYSSSKETLILIEQSMIPFKGEFGFVGILEIMNTLKDMALEMSKEMINEMNVAQLIIQNELTEICGEEIILSNIGTDQVAFIKSYDENPTSDDLKKMEINLSKLMKQLENKYSIKVNIGIGRKYDQLLKIHQSYEEAKSSLPLIQSLEQRPKIYKYEDSFHGEVIEFYYPIELEYRLINAVTDGELEEVDRLLEKLYSDNVTKRIITPNMGYQILECLKSTILRVLAKNSQINPVIVEEIYNQFEELLNKKMEFTSSFELVRKLLLEITESIHERKFAGNMQMLKKIKETIKINFSDPDLCLYKISEAVNLPEKMLPTIFKEYVGINISDYIEDVRINFAKTKLGETTLSIEEIAEQAGYNSAHSFRRAFKRKTGTSPSDFRKMVKNINK
ncbi:helix-turn-helix domain-containing protein [Lederbergia wuyishanensis]|uniref:AraC-like DNA-binding protein/sugar diacid utilization regulator n=1 Tax=Lederbergia wuyishanensis TaxID=1347903 RepID=A0ABU0D433_9BACI|nr:helix-turn-helix domain-containing protein [Lederbergia wuyishanensis]MDQ0343163.1 AraC-like DNA-binding protein/sugar diacid utilization regulator [Lederbergia wuyishanensis]